MKIFRPLQLAFNHLVMEQNRKFYFIASATLGINLRTGNELLEFDLMKDALACMGESPLPDTGMPKPNGEVLVSGKCFASGGEAVPAQKVSLQIGSVNKTLYVFGDRCWKRVAGIMKAISEPKPFKEIEISYQNAYGGEGYEKNPAGKGFAPVKDENGKTIHPLPNIEDPENLIGSPGDHQEPVGLSALDPMLPQRMRFQGTYDQNYKKKYFPGYPEDHDWHYFLCAPQDQWINGFFKGDEPFAISNMHPDVPEISGTLPGLYPRCFIRHTVNSSEPVFTELPMNLDTLWFFPEKMLVLLIWRKGVEVRDDEAEQISHVLLAYEERAQEPRDLDYYSQALKKRLTSDDALLNTLNTEDLIPIGHKCAMELLQERAMADDEEGAFAKNMEAKADSVKKMADEKTEEAIQQAEKDIGGVNIPGGVTDRPENAKTFISEEGKIDLKKMLEEEPETDQVTEAKALNQKLESLMPGITAGDPEKIELKHFSFDKLNRMMEAMREFSDEKEREAKDLAKERIIKAKEQVRTQLEDAQRDQDQMPLEEKEKLEETLKKLDKLDLDNTPKTPLPRLDAKAIMEQMPPLAPRIMDAMQYVQAAKAMGVEDADTKDLKKQVQESVEASTKQVEEGLRVAEKSFKEAYSMGAHLMEDGLSPHEEPKETIGARLLAAIEAGEDVSGGDWACIDLSGRKLDGVDLRGAYLEQVNFKGASLKGANLSGSIMARADLTDADLTGANLEEANVGAVHAERANFTDANLKSARLSKGVFTDADFTRVEFENVGFQEVSLNDANFTEAHMPGIRFIESGLMGTRFPKADLSTTVFMDCDVKDADFQGTRMSHCVFADARLENVSFEGANLNGTCFVATDPEKAGMKDVRFRGANLNQSCFKDMEMQGADLTEASMENANFGGTDLSDADLSGAYANRAQFRKARLAGARLDGINLMEGSLAKAYLVNASFRGANLYGVDFLRSTVSNTDFHKSNLESTLIEHWRPK